MQLSHALAEKNASLESLVRATAAATKEAGKLVRAWAGRVQSWQRWLVMQCSGSWHCVPPGLPCTSTLGPTMPAPLPAPQSEAHEATKAQLAAAQEASATLQADLTALQAQHAAACSAKSELVKEKGQLEKRVRRCWGR